MINYLFLVACLCSVGYMVLAAWALLALCTAAAKGDSYMDEKKLCLCCGTELVETESEKGVCGKCLRELNVGAGRPVIERPTLGEVPRAPQKDEEKE